MNKEELTPHLEELKRVLEGKAGEDELLKELETYLNVYHVDVKAAKRGILRKFGAEIPDFGFAATGESVSKKIGELGGSETSVDILAKVVFVEKKSVRIKGATRTIVSGILGDDTGTASFTVWDGEACELVKGAVYSFKNAYTKLWNDKIQINLGSKSVILKENKELELPERQISYSSSVAKVCDLREGIGNVTVTVKILSVESKEITIKDERRTVFSGWVADPTGKIQFSAWKDFELVSGETVCVKNAYIRSWKGIPQLNLGDRTEVDRVDDTIGEIDQDALSVKTIGNIIRTGGGLDITISGSVLELRAGSGLIKRCPQCNKSVRNGECTAHGTVDAIPDLRMKVIIDDGTGAMSAILNKNATESITGVSLQNAIDLSKARGESECVAKELADRIVMKHLTLTGNVMSDDFGPAMIVKSAKTGTVDVKEEASKLLAKVQEAIL